MRAVVGSQLGSLDHYSLSDAPIPVPGPGDVRLKVQAVGLGYVDGLVAQGKYQLKPALPFTPGGEMAGTVDALGDGVSGVAIGERVSSWVLGGGLAEYCVVPANTLHRLGAGLDYARAAAMTVNYATAYHALHDRAHLVKGETLLVLGASGGVGVAAIEIGKYLGAKVVAAASTSQKRDFAKALGADVVIDYTAEDWRTTLRDLLGGKGVDVVIDPVGGAVFEPAFRSLNWGGRHLVVGFTGGPIPALRTNLALLKGASLVGVDIRQFSEKEAAKAAANLALLYKMAEEGKLRVPLHEVYPLERFAEAMDVAMSGKALGKVAVKI